MVIELGWDSKEHILCRIFPERELELELQIMNMAGPLVKKYIHNL